jgi:hypothetical protein
MKIKSLTRCRCLLLAFIPTLAFGTSATSSKGIATMDYFIGTWDCAGDFPSSGKAIASTIRFDRDLAVKGIVKHHDDRPPSIYHATELWVYQSAAATFNGAIADNFGGVREFQSTGWQGDQLTWQSTGVKPAQRFVYRRIDDRTFRLDWDVSPKGAQYVVGDTLTCKRRAGSGGR